MAITYKHAYAVSVLILALASSNVSYAADIDSHAWPQRPIKMLVPAAAGGSTDQGARLIARTLTEQLKQSVVVDNRGGGGGRIAPYEVARATADGYTILFGNSIGNALMPAVVKKLNYDPLKDFKPIGIAFSYSTLLTCNKRKGLADFAKFKAYAESKPGEISIANAGPGSGNHFASELLGQRLNLKFTHVPYRGNAPAVQDVLAGSADCIMMTEAKPYVDSGSLIAIATSGSHRDPRFPSIPTFDELGVKGYQAEFWQAIFVPFRTPDAVVQKLSTALENSVKQLSDSNQMKDVGFTPTFVPSAQVNNRIQQEMRQYQSIAQQSAIVIE